jgi:hypothetical protein
MGGTIFSVSIATLLSEANSYFSDLFQGRWELKLEFEDQTLFIDHSPQVFEFVLDYLRGQELVLDELSETKLRLLRNDADFFGLHQLHKWLTWPTRGTISKSIMNRTLRVASNKSGGWTNWVQASEAFTMPHKGWLERRVRILSGDAMIGIAPHEMIADRSKTHKSCGHFISSQKEGIGANKRLSPGCEVAVRVHHDGSVSFVMNGEDLGTAFVGISGEVDLFLTIGVYRGEVEVLLYN